MPSFVVTSDDMTSPSSSGLPKSSGAKPSITFCGSPMSSMCTSVLNPTSKNLKTGATTTSKFPSSKFPNRRSIYEFAFQSVICRAWSHFCASEICNGNWNFIPSSWNEKRIGNNLRPAHTVTTRLAKRPSVLVKPRTVRSLTHPYILI